MAETIINRMRNKGGNLRDPSRIDRSGSDVGGPDRKSTRLNSSHSQISYAVFCLKKKKRRYWRYRFFSYYDVHLTRAWAPCRCAYSLSSSPPFCYRIVSSHLLCAAALTHSV